MMRRRLPNALLRLRVLALGLVALLVASCGLPEDLVVVQVSGLEPAITELRVTITLDMIAAKNLHPVSEVPDPNSFTVYQDMQRFGIQIPAGTSTLGVSIEGLNTAREVRKRGNGTINLAQGQEMRVTLN
jgi:hypothetical protein